jgi:hypothetical protein
VSEGAGEGLFALISVLIWLKGKGFLHATTGAAPVSDRSDPFLGVRSSVAAAPCTRPAAACKRAAAPRAAARRRALLGGGAPTSARAARRRRRQAAPAPAAAATGAASSWAGCSAACAHRRRRERWRRGRRRRSCGRPTRTWTRASRPTSRVRPPRPPVQSSAAHAARPRAAGRPRAPLLFPHTRTPSRAPPELLRRTEEKREERKEERLKAYYRRNFKEYFGGARRLRASVSFDLFVLFKKRPAVCYLLSGRPAACCTAPVGRARSEGGNAGASLLAWLRS